MTNEATKQTLALLGVNSPEKIPAMFAELRAEFDRELSAATDDANWKSVRDAWLGRKSGVISQVTDNWLKPAAPDLKRSVGQELNQIKAHVESALAERQKISADMHDSIGSSLAALLAYLGTETINLPAHGHTSFELASSYASAAGKQGTVEIGRAHV